MPLPFTETAIVDGDGLRAHAAEGIAKGAVYRMASMAKPIASVAALMLAERGRLDLDAPIARHLPAYAGWPVIVAFDAARNTPTTRAARRPITARHLLTHTAGFSYGISHPLGAALERAGHADATRWPLLHDPGERWSYGCSTTVLGDLIEAVSGRGYPEFVHDEIFAPLGMHDTAVGAPVGGWARVAPAFQRTADGLAPLPPPRPDAPPYRRADGGLMGTVADYARFVRMLLRLGELDGARLLSAGGVRAMFRDQLGGAPIELQDGGLPRLALPFPEHAGEDSFGLGFQLRSRAIAGERAPGSGSWAGLYNTHFWIDHARGIGGVFCTQLLPFCDAGAMRALNAFERGAYAPPAL